MQTSYQYKNTFTVETESPVRLIRTTAAIKDSMLSQHLGKAWRDRSNPQLFDLTPKIDVTISSPIQSAVEVKEVQSIYKTTRVSPRYVVDQKARSNTSF